ncbi:MAG: 1,2-diacylglycerol 3-alpha-glucosyltransferase [Hyphomicrobiaceae bacterium]|jgi:1,2-diacylglycerol 3-alpha-glucosyltransferase
MKPRRIAMVAACPFPSPQGSQVFVAQMCEELAARGHDVHLLTYGQGHRVLDGGYEHHRIGRLPGDDALRSGPSAVKPLLDAMLARALISLLRSQRFDVIHAHNYEATLAGLFARARTGIPVLHHSHTLFADELPSYFKARTARAMAALIGGATDRFIPILCDRTIALCEESAGVLAGLGVARDRIDVIEPAVRDDGLLVDMAAARRDLDLPVDDFLVGYSGNLDAYQTLSTLLQASRELQGDTRVRFVISSHDASSAVARQLAHEGSSTIVREVHGWAQARRAIEACDVMVLPRKTGAGFPIKLLNYMSAGKAVVTAGCGAKLVRDGIDGLVVADGSPSCLATALKGLANDPERAHTLAQNARRTYLAQLTWDRILPRIEASYERLLDC